MSHELDPTPSHKSKRWAEYGKEALAQGAIPVTSLLADAFLPGSGLLTTTGLTMSYATWSARRAKKASDAFTEIIRELSKRVDSIEDDAARAVTLDFIFSDEYLNELWTTLETIGRAKDQEKVEAAKTFVVNVGLDRGDVALDDFVSAFLRDATITDIQALLTIPEAGRIVPVDQIRNNIVYDNLTRFFDQLVASLGLQDNPGIADGSVGRLAMLGLIATKKDLEDRSCPVQRTPFGDFVAARIS